MSAAPRSETLHDGDDVFEVTAIRVDRPSHAVLFAVGGGGDPRRHLPLLTALAERGVDVVAPHFDRMISPTPTAEGLMARARRSRIALDAVARPRLPAVGIGHSIGAATLLALAGAALWLDAKGPLAIPRDDRLSALALMAPATGFFRPPGALDGVRVPIVAWAGSLDPITPPAQAELLRQAMSERVPVAVHIAVGAGHFAFMHAPPPHADDALSDRAGFLADLVREIVAFVLDR